MNKLNFAKKFLLLGVLLIAPLLALTYIFFLNSHQNIESTSSQLQSLKLIQSYFLTTQSVQEYRDFVVGLNNSQERSKKNKTKELIRLNSLLVSIPYPLQNNAEWNSLYQNIQRIKKGEQNQSVDEDSSIHSQVIIDIHALTDKTANYFQILLDTKSDSYYAVNSLINIYPHTLELLSKLRGLGTQIIAKQSLSTQQKTHLIELISDLKQSLKILNIDQEKMVLPNQSVKTLTHRTADMTRSSQQLINSMEQALTTQTVTLSAHKFFTLTTDVINHSYDDIYQIILPAIEQHLQSKIVYLQNMLYLILGIVLSLLLLVIYLVTGTYYGATRNIRAISESTQALSEGSLNQKLQLNTSDEFHDIANIFNNMTNGIHPLVAELRASNDRLQHILDTAVDAVIQINHHGVITGWNKQAEIIFGWQRREALQQKLHELLIPKQYQKAHLDGVRQFLLSRQRTVLNSLIEVTALHRDGHEIPIELSITSIENKTDGSYEFNAFIRDITKQQVNKEKLQLSNLIFQHSSEAMLISDSNNRILTVNAAFTKITGYLEQEVINKTPAIFSSGTHDQQFYQTMWRQLLKAGSWSGEITNRHKSGKLFVERLTINTVFNKNGTVYRHIAIFNDITEQKATEQLIWQQANIDQLTQLSNRNRFQQQLKQEIKKAVKVKSSFSLIFIDLDFFKEVNDTLGHAYGDLILIEAAQRISSCIRSSDYTARLGGDEFTVILTNLQKNNEPVEQVITDIVHKLSQPFLIENEVIHLSGSAGITFFPKDSKEVKGLLRNADHAMYAAKQAGRNGFSYYSPSMLENTLQRIYLIHNLRQAITANQFSLHYQPIVDLHSGKMIKTEALILWNHPTDGLIRPEKFIPLAEESGLIHDIGNWVFITAVKQLKIWREKYNSQLTMSINRSPTQFQRHLKNMDWCAEIERLGLPGDAITIEITEGLLLDSDVSVTDQLHQFQQHGMEIALDDFGTGYSSLSYLKKFDIDFLKIDQSFVKNLTADSDDKVLIEAIIIMSHKLGLNVIAEGIETEEQKNLLIAAGCDFGQGYYLSYPLSADEFEQLLSQPTPLISSDLETP